MALERRTYTGPSSQAGSLACGGAAVAATDCVCVAAVKSWPRHGARSRRVAVVSVEALGVSLGGAATGADLGGSSKYSSENLEGRGGEGFHGNSSWPWVRRS
uniref:Uncharacterized protein n=1 Tax=Mesocestoides corti TaxID=53468 RepID=A0A0R3UD55_MESCO